MSKEKVKHHRPDLEKKDRGGGLSEKALKEQKRKVEKSDAGGRIDHSKQKGGGRGKKA